MAKQSGLGDYFAVDNSAGDWPRHTQAITEFLGLPPLLDPPDAL